MGQREKLVEMLKSVGRDLIENAENYIPADTKWLQNIDFSFGFMAGHDVDVPDLSISTTWLQKEVIDTIVDKNSKGE